MMCEIAPFIFQGVLITLKYTSLSLLGGLSGGIFLACLKLSSWSLLRGCANGYTALFRGTPLLVQLGLIYYGIPQIMGHQLSVFQAGILAFSLNSTAYTSEIIRGGIQSIDPGQWESARTLGLSSSQTLIFVILPQAIRCSIPALVNEWIDLIKESALISTLSEMDLLRRAQVISAEKFVFFEPYLVAALAYFILISSLNRLVKWIAKKTNHGV